MNKNLEDLRKIKSLKKAFISIIKNIWKDGLLKWGNDNEPEYFNNRAEQLIKEVTTRFHLKV